MEKHRVKAENAARIWEWLETRGGIVVWDSVNLSNPGASWTGPLNDKDGKPAIKPNWQCANTPGRVITDAAEVVVDVPKEVKRFHIAIRMGSQGISYKVTDGGTRRIRAACAKAGKDSWYEFNYVEQSVV